MANSPGADDRHAAGDFLRHALRRQKLLNPFHVALEHRLRGGHAWPEEQRVLGCQRGLQVLFGNVQILEFHRVDLLHFGHLKGGGVAFAVRSAATNL